MFEKLFFDSSKSIVENAKSLRKNQTEAEKLLWNYLRNKQINGYKFRRQHYIESYIVDFFCWEKMLSIELDGGIYLRTERLKELGITELRFSNDEVLNNVLGVLDKIKLELIKIY
jgi:very-short-patch-repair endonuclease